jgi:uncharacterized protein YbbC (DUF1343 family)
LAEYHYLIAGQRTGLVTNASAVTSEVIPAADALLAACSLQVLLSPEHGLASHEADGAHVASTVDPHTQLPVYSLYGETKRPGANALQDLDVLVFDIQDVGARFYTYVWTMSYVLEAAAEYGVPLIVLDRPNPIGGQVIEGPAIEPGYESFVGRYLLPLRHGLTVGELARLFNAELGLDADLTVVKMEGWQRSMWFDQTRLPWVPPSPAMPKLDTAVVYPGLCLLEGTNISDGRGTATPFESIGAPWIDAYRLADALNDLTLPGVRFRPMFFCPSSSKYVGQTCQGVYVHVTDRQSFRPLGTGLHVIHTIRHLWPQDFSWLETSWEGRPPHFDLLIGNGWVRRWIDQGQSVVDIIARWQETLEGFDALRQRHVLYG